MILTEEQTRAVDMITKWYHEGKKQTFVLSGIAGSGKSTVLKYISESLNIERIAYCSFTAKAARVMINKGIPTATTIHSLMYEPTEYTDENGKRQVIFTARESLGNIDLIIVDEASTVGKTIQQDLESFGIAILYVGDIYQLPPIQDSASNLMLNPDVRLEQIHRQALDNPIIFCANQVRQGKVLPYGKFGSTVMKISKDKITPEILSRADQILCGKNITRHKLNDQMREFYGHKTEFPQEEEKLICLQNNKKNGLINGMTGRCLFYDPKKHSMDFISDEDEEFFGLTADHTIFKRNPTDRYSRTIDRFDFGYCITVSKAQGSEWNNVIVFEEHLGDSLFHRKWLYTSVTRASQRLIIVS